MGGAAAAGQGPQRGEGVAGDAARPHQLPQGPGEDVVGGADPGGLDLLGQLTSMTYYPEVEFLSGLSLLLVLFCLLFSGRPEKKRRSRAGSGNAQETA